MIVTLAVRAFQVLFSIVVLGLSIALIKCYGPAYEGKALGTPPALVGYTAFVGGAGLLIAVVGIVACFIEVLTGVVMLALDAFATFFIVAGGIAYAVKVGVGNCDDWSVDLIKLAQSYIGKRMKLFGPSESKNFGEKTESKYLKAWLEDASGRCRMFQAETAFLWLMFAMFCVSICLTFLNKASKRNGGVV